MNILMFTNTYTPVVGGVERSINSFKEKLLELGHKVMIVTLEFDGHYEKEENVIRIPAIRKFNGSDFSVRLPIPVNLRKHIKNFKPDVIHSHHPFMLGDTALRTARIYNIPIVFTYHTKYEEYTHYVPINSKLMKKFVIELTKGYCDLVDRIIAPSFSIKKMLIERGVDTPISVVPTGINAEFLGSVEYCSGKQFYGFGKDDFVIGHIGRLALEKNLIFLANVIGKFLAENRNAKFLLCGKGPMLDEMMKIFSEYGVKERVYYGGVVKGESLKRAYSAMDVFVFSSKTETQGIVLLEAMACGVPVVALKATGVEDFVRDAETGKIVEKEDVDDFYRNILFFYRKSYSERKVFSHKARKYAFNFDIDNATEKLIEVYNEVLKSEIKTEKIEISGSLWEKTIAAIEAEWEIISNITDAAKNVIENNLDKKKRSLPVRFKKWIDIDDLTIKILGLKKERITHESGLVILQIDGLSKNQLLDAIATGKMRFLKKLINKENYKILDFYSGLPSNTPSVQGECFYGEKCCVPSFSFFHREKRKIYRMYDYDCALDVEKKIDKQTDSLVFNGSAYSCIFSGGARETHFCAVDMGWDVFWKKAKPIRVFFAGLLRFKSILSGVCEFMFEFFNSIYDLLEGAVKNKELMKELKFLFSRLAITVFMRRLITFGVNVDISRGLPIIYANLIGYDEHAHRRGPSSVFAKRTLKNIDRSIKKIFKRIKKSNSRVYDLWIISDHGQEDVLSYEKICGETIRDAVLDIARKLNLQDKVEKGEIEKKGIQSFRATFLGWNFFDVKKYFSSNASIIESIIVTAMGPIGHIYFPYRLNDNDKKIFSRKLVDEKKVPFVFFVSGEKKVIAISRNGEFVLNEEPEKYFGENRKFMPDLLRDFEMLCKHRYAGDFIISGWRYWEKPISFPIENGAHGGPGVNEVNGFAFVPSDIFADKDFVRGEELKKAAMLFLRKKYFEKHIVDSSKDKKIIRIATYNIHSCAGTDLKIIPERIGRVLLRIQPDIVALQEVDVNCIRTYRKNQAELIANMLGMEYIFHPAMKDGEQYYGIAVLSRYPMRKVFVKNFKSKFLGNEPRVAVCVEVDLGEEKMKILNTHLGLSKRNRKEQIEALLKDEWIKNESKKRFVLIGDFNMFPSSSEYRKIVERFSDVQKVLREHTPKATFSSVFSFGRIDHIFVSRDLQVEKVDVPKTILEKTASDHLPLVVDLSIEG